MASPEPRAGQPVHDPRVLRAIAHPARNRILTELSASGPLRAADIARSLDMPANQASFHLRQLAKYGLVEEAPDAARDRRDRVWRMVNERGVTVDLREMEEAPGGKAAVSVFRRASVVWAHGVVERAFDTIREEGVFRSVSDHALKLTKDEAAELARELDDVIAGWAARTRGRDEERRTYLVFQVIQPYPDDAEPRRPADRPDPAG
jgi:DNA-binding transcriptional ArsR family regulator